ncbi:hypothetical protein BGW39_006262 [Mortierella sp. 14UC]|nr:hypothetical protein BGW39_006262 [Mortierella sp. 14UC]
MRGAKNVGQEDAAVVVGGEAVRSDEAEAKPGKEAGGEADGNEFEEDTAEEAYVEEETDELEEEAFGGRVRGLAE